MGPTEELFPNIGHSNVNGNGHAPVPVNGNGANDHNDEAEEPHQTLFSWTDRMAEEPVKPKHRNGKSMFEWALSQGHERETVGAGH